MLNKSSNIAFLDVDSMKVFFSDDGGTTWIAGKVDADGKVVAKKIDEMTSVKQDDIKDELNILNSLIPSGYDYIDFSYAGGNLSQVVFKTGGESGSVISTLDLSYDGSNNLIDVSQS